MSTKPKSKANMQFVGGAQTVSSSFLALAMDSLNQYCTNWNNLSDPASYILPPTFIFKNADKSDEDIEMVKTQFDLEKKDGTAQKVLSSIERPVIDRQSDNAEFVVFQAIWKLVQEKIQAPFLTVHNLNLGSDLKPHLQTIFPNAPCVIQEKYKNMMREYDFVLIGPHIGIIVIEVKSSYFTKQKDFGANNRKWPDHIVNGVEQLNSFDLEFFKDCSGNKEPFDIKTVRRILFTPNLEKTRLEAWLNNMDDLAKENAKKWLANSGITHWMKDDLKTLAKQNVKKWLVRSGGITNWLKKAFSKSIRDLLEPDLYNTIRQMLEAPGFQIPQEIYESYGLIISGLSSAVVLENQPTVCVERLSTSTAILNDAVKLDTHDYLQKLQTSLNSTKPKKQKANINLDTVSINIDKVNSKLILLTPEQRAALNGPERQFIFGGPGTGKTIILQVKAVELLKEEKKILVLALPSYQEKFQKFFDNYGYDKYEIWSHGLITEMADHNDILTDQFFKKLMLGNSPLQNTLDTLSEYTKNILEIRYCLKNFDAILVDDALDIYEYFDVTDTKRLLFAMLLLTHARSYEFSSKVVWIAGDACSTDSIFTPILGSMLKGQQQGYFTCAVLHRVMRSSVNVFKATYSQEILRKMRIKPSLGHNIHGFSESVSLQRPSLLEIWEQTDCAVKKFRDEGFDYAHMAVILGGRYTTNMSALRTYLESEFRKNGIPVDHATSHSLSLTLDIFNEVSSLEWPVVVYVALLRYIDGFEAAYYRYRACSRATMKLFEIIAEWPDDSEGDDSLANN